MAFERLDTKLRAGKPVSFRFKDCVLYGMLHFPPAGAVRQDTGIIILNPGPTDRCGPQRLYFKLADRFASEGFPVLRFDARGVGESEGEWDEKNEGGPITNIFVEIQRGAWVPDTQAAIEFMMQEAGVQHLILGGLCGGALTALLAGADHPKVTGLLMMGTPITLSSTTANVQDLPEDVLARDAGLYFKKLFSPSAWRRLLTFKTDYKTLWGVLASRIHSRIPPRPSNPYQAMNPKIDPPFLKAFESAVAAGKKICFVYSENDYLWQEFKEYFLPSFENQASFPFELATIPNSNHNMTEIEWQDRLNQLLLSWLEKFTTALSGKKK